MVVLDSTFLIALHKGDPGAEAALDALGDQTRWLPAAAWVEFVSGFPVRRSDALVEELDKATVFEPFDRPHAEIAARIQSQLALAGMVLSWHDLQIAATAIQLGDTLLTSDAAFDRVPGLKVASF